MPIAATTGHKSMTVLRGYIRDGSLFTENAAAAANCDPMLLAIHWALLHRSGNDLPAAFRAPTWAK